MGLPFAATGGTPITPSPFRSWWKVVSSDSSALLLPDTTLVHNWQNTWAFRAGLTYRTGSSWVAGGFVYDQTPQPDSDAGPFLPDANRTGGTIGAGFGLSKHFQFQFSSLFLWFHQRTITTSKDNFNGTYQTFAILPSVTLKSTF